ncbi:MAG: hypothetical protein ABIW35_06950, partial [Luteimonas sp.]
MAAEISDSAIVGDDVTVSVEATRVEPVQIPAVATEASSGGASHRIDWRRAGLAFAATGALVVLVLGAFAIGYDGIHAG